MTRSLLSLCLALAFAACKKEPPPTETKPAAPLEVKGKRIDVVASDKGFEPSSIQVKKGEPTTLVFTRKTNDTCATDVVFPALNLKKELPLDQPVAIELPVDQDRTLAFTCGMGMYESKVVVQ